MEKDEGVPIEKRTKHVHGRVEAQEVIAEMLAHARHKISVFAPTLDDYLFNTSRVAEALASFAAAGRNNMARFLIEDVDRSLHHNGRVIEMCRRLADFIKVREVDEDHTGLREMFLVIDDNSYLHQPDMVKPDYIAGFDTRGEAKRFTTRYERMWERSHSISAIHTLGL